MAEWDPLQIGPRHMSENPLSQKHVIGVLAAAAVVGAVVGASGARQEQPPTSANLAALAQLGNPSLTPAIGEPGQLVPLPAYPGQDNSAAGLPTYTYPAAGQASNVAPVYDVGIVPLAQRPGETARSGNSYRAPRAPSFSIGDPAVLNPAGPGQYSDASGTVYIQAGPHGVVNEATGEFSPTN